MSCSPARVAVVKAADSSRLICMSKPASRSVACTGVTIRSCSSVNTKHVAVRGLPSFWRMPPGPGVQPASVKSRFDFSRLHSYMRGRICSFGVAPGTSGCRKPWETSA